MDITGRIHSIETFGTLDGPGIRFVVFMQGCPLQCIYCHNRDTWDLQGGHEYTVDEIMEALLKYINYIRLSGGGITVSGGEPLLQLPFVTALFKRCHEKGIHTALDTSGFTNMEGIEELLSFTDLVLLDIKHTCDIKHKAITGVDRSKPAAFAQLLSKRRIPVWIRYVLIPGYTDSDVDLQAAASFINSLNHVHKIEVLPYHSMGSYKWEELGQLYPLTGVPEPDEKSVEKARQILTK